VRPIFDQKTRRDGKTDSELLRALQWWVEVLRDGITELRKWDGPVLPTGQLFCDASGNPAYLGAVLLIDQHRLYCHMPVPKALSEFFYSRRDNQIMGLELLAITMGLMSFKEYIRGRKLIVHCDNTGSEVCVRLVKQYVSRIRV